jgi:hypothetical protein
MAENIEARNAAAASAVRRSIMKKRNQPKA